MRILAIGEGKKPYDPWPEMRKAHESEAQFVLVSGAERVGKSIAAAAEGLSWVPFSRLIWFGGEQYEHSHQDFDYLAEALINMGEVRKRDISRPKNGAWTMELKGGCRIATRTLKDMYASLVSEAPDLIILCEAGQIRKDPRDKIRLRLSTRRGRCWIGGTMEDGAPWLAEAYDEWQNYPNEDLGQSFSVPLYANTQDFPGGRDDPEIVTMRNTMRAPVYLARVEGRPAPSELLVFADMFGRGSKPRNAKPCPYVEFDADGREIPVEVAIDPGYYPAHYTVSFMQRHGQEIHNFDEIAVLRATHEQVIAIATARPWWPKVIGGTIDPFAGKRHADAADVTPAQHWADGTGINLRMDTQGSVEALIERYRFYHKHPHTGECRFFYDPVRCPHKLYEDQRWKYNRDAQGHPDRSSPSRKHCDCIKGIGYYLVDLFNREFWHRRFPVRQPKVSSWRWR